MSSNPFEESLQRGSAHFKRLEQEGLARLPQKAIEDDESGRCLLGQANDPTFCRMQAHLKCIEGKSAIDRNDQFAIKYKCLRRNSTQVLQHLGVCVGRACTEGIRLYTARMVGETPDPKLVAGANQIASEAVQGIAGSLIEGKLVYKDFAIALDDAGMREGLKEALLRNRGRLSFDEKRWMDDLKTLNEEQKDLPTHTMGAAASRIVDTQRIFARSIQSR